MKLTLGLANTIITIDLLGQTQQVAHLCHEYFKDFLCPEQETDAEVKVSIQKNLNDRSPVKNRGQAPVFEKRLPIKETIAWLNHTPRHNDNFQITETIISSFFLDGLLLFNPETAEGRIYLLQDGPGCFLSIYRLFWVYLAQVLGERKGCFIHSAALAKGEKGYLFLGDSGAGKSSLAKICGGSKLFSDDSPALCERNGEYLVFPSPYHQIGHLKGLAKEVIGQRAKLAGFYFLFKDNRTYLESLSKKESLSLIINRHIHYFQYLSTRARLLLFELFLDACNKIPSYNFHFCLNTDIWNAIDS